MDKRVQELLDTLYAMVKDAWAIPLGQEKCVVERDKVLDLLDEIKAGLPAELREARQVMASRTEILNTARQSAEQIRQKAEAERKQMTEQDAVVQAAKARASAMINEAETKSADLRRMANEYADDTLRRTEEAIGEALNEVRQSRSKFRAVTVAARQKPAEPDI